MNTGAFLEVILHMVNGCELQFIEQKEDRAKEILKNVNPQKFFTDKHLVISDDSSTTRVLLDAVSCATFNTSAAFNWSFPSHIEDAMVLSKDRFLQAIDSELEKPGVIADPGQRTRPVSLFLELLMHDGSKWYLRIFAETLKPMERIELAKIVSALTGFHAIKPEGGAVLFNMKNVVARTTYPTAMLSPQNEWKINRA